MNKSFKIVEKSKIFFIISAILIIAGIVLLIVPGMNLGLDFTEGASIDVNLNIDYKDGFEDKLIDFIEGEKFTVPGDARIIEGGSTIQIDLSYRYDGKEVQSKEDFTALIGDEKSGLIHDLIEGINDGSILGVAAGENVDLDGGIASTFTSPDATASLTRKAFLAIAIAIVAMLIYIAIRFKLSAGISAIIVLCHDVFIMITLTTFAGIFGVKVNTTFIAAVITVIGYSINATIIVFDRIKENLVKYEGQGMTDADVANLSIKETLRRTIFTTVTTLVMIVLVAALGVSSIREFALPIIFGLLSGAYSAIVLSSCVWVQIRKLGSKIKKDKKGYQKYAKEKIEA